jgi:hypothetical protein
MLGGVRDGVVRRGGVAGGAAESEPAPASTIAGIVTTTDASGGASANDGVATPSVKMTRRDGTRRFMISFLS